MVSDCQASCSGWGFGVSVAISGDVIVVGAPVGDNTSPGAAYIFHWDGLAWSETAKLSAEDGALDDMFGLSVAIDGETVVVGADGNDDFGESSGSAYVFDWNGLKWSQTGKLVAADGSKYNYFGFSVAINCQTVVVGAHGKDSAYVFGWNGLGWSQFDKLTPADRTDQYWFGSSMAISGQTVVVSAYGDDEKGKNSGSAYFAMWYQKHPHWPRLLILQHEH